MGIWYANIKLLFTCCCCDAGFVDCNTADMLLFGYWEGEQAIFDIATAFEDEPGV